MKTKKRVLPALLLSLFAGTGAATAEAAQFSNFYAFGDSLTDAGYFRPFLSSLGLPAPLVATLGRFTTNPGPVWSELVATFYGVTPRPSNAGGTIYAQGGATVATNSTSTPPGSAQRPVSVQINEFLAANSAADPGALYAVWAGANDIFQNLGAFAAGAITQAQLQTNVLGAAAAEIQQVGRLRAAGARYILVFGLPNIGATPQFAGAGATAAAVTALSAGYNTTLFTGLQGAGIRVIPVDTFTFFAEVLASPGAYGFTNATNVACGPFPPITTTPSAQFCYGGNLVAAGADRTYLFADGVHPTTAAHAIIAQFVEGLVEGPSQLSLMAESALRNRTGHVRTLSLGLGQAQGSTVGKFTAFAAADGASFDVDEGSGTVGQRSNNESYTVGVTARATEALTLGFGIGKTKTRASFGAEAGGYQTDETALSLFGAIREGGFHLSGAASIGDIDFNNVRRRIRLGPLVRTAESRPQGSNASAFLSTGYDFGLGKFTVGPVVSVQMQNVDINSFDESGAGASNLRIGSQKRKSEVWSVGGRASYDLDGFTPFVRVTVDKERRDEVRFVTASPLSLASGNSYEIPAYQSDDSFVTTHVGVRGRVNDWIGVSVMYYNVSSRSGIHEDGITGSVSIRF